MNVNHRPTVWISSIRPLDRWHHALVAVALGAGLALATRPQILRAHQQTSVCVATGVEVATPTGSAGPDGSGDYTFHGECDISWDCTMGDVTECKVCYLAETFQWSLLGGWSLTSSAGPYPSLPVECDSSNTIMSLEVGSSGLSPNTWYRMRVSSKAWNPAIGTDGQPVGCSGPFTSYEDKDYKTGPAY